MKRILVNTKKAPAALGAYNQAVIADKTMYISGQIGLNPETAQMVSGGVEAETRQALINMGAILKAAGIDFRNVVKCTVLLADINDFVKANSVYAEFFKGPCEPARAAFQVAALPKAARIEIEAVAIIDKLEDAHMGDAAKL